ncbi:MAG: photosystem I assembly protein Ycf4 [Cyanobacteriota bacterium]|jgi:hypothetical protein
MSPPPKLAPTPTDKLFEQQVTGARRLSNVVAAVAVSVGGTGFLLASLSSRLGHDLLPILHAADLAWIPQGIVMGFYGLAALALATYLWLVIGVDLGSGVNRFDKASGLVVISRQGLRRLIEVEIPLREIQAVRLEVRDGLSPLRRLVLRVQGRRDLPLTRVGDPLPLSDLELSGASLARFLGVPLEGL